MLGTIACFVPSSGRSEERQLYGRIGVSACMQRTGCPLIRLGKGVQVGRSRRWTRTKSGAGDKKAGVFPAQRDRWSLPRGHLLRGLLLPKRGRRSSLLLCKALVHRSLYTPVPILCTVGITAGNDACAPSWSVCASVSGRKAVGDFGRSSVHCTPCLCRYERPCC